MREKAKKDLKKKLTLIRLTIADRKLAEKLSKERGESVSQFFRNLLKEEHERILYRPYRNKIEQQNRELTEKLRAVEKSIRVMN
jgi:hypothetical protein